MGTQAPTSITSPPWSGRTKRIVALITLGLLFLLSLQLLNAWSVVVIAAVLSYLLNPLADAIEEHSLRVVPHNGIRRSLAVLITFIIVIFTIALIVLLIMPPIAVQTQEFVDNFPKLISSTEENLEETLNHPINIGNRTITVWDEMMKTFGSDSSLGSINGASAFSEAASALSAPVVNAATLVFGFAFDFLFAIVLMFYLLLDGNKLVHSCDRYIPESYLGDLNLLRRELANIWNAYLRGQLLLGLIVGVTTGIAASILGLPQPLVLGLLAGLLEFIPNIGPILASVPAVLFALISESTTIPGLEGVPFALIVMLLYTVIQQAEALFLVPRVMGNNLDLHPFVILVAVLSGAAVAGLLGIILAAPVVATMRLILIYIWGKLVDIDPFAGTNRLAVPGQPHPEQEALPSNPVPALGEPYTPPQRGEIVKE